MLAAHHDCGAPLFRYHGQVVCPVCSFDDFGELIREGPSGGPLEPLTPSATVEGIAEVGRSDSPDKPPVTPTTDRAAVLEPLSPQSRPITSSSLRASRSSEEEQEEGRLLGGDTPAGQVREVEVELVRTMLDKLRELAVEIPAEHDLFRLKQLLECMEVALRLLHSLQRRD